MVILNFTSYCRLYDPLCRAESWGDGRLWAWSAHLRQIVGLFISGNTDVTGYPLHFDGETAPPKFREPLSAPNCEATVRWRVAAKAQDGRSWVDQKDSTPRAKRAEFTRRFGDGDYLAIKVATGGSNGDQSPEQAAVIPSTGSSTPRQIKATLLREACKASCQANDTYYARGEGRMSYWQNSFVKWHYATLKESNGGEIIGVCAC
jgi:hypothetical protein